MRSIFIYLKDYEFLLKEAIKSRFQDVARRAFEAARILLLAEDTAHSEMYGWDYKYPTFSDYEKSLSDKEQKE